MLEPLYFAYAYMRISQSDEKKGGEYESNSITNQRALIQEYLKKHPEIRLVGEKIDDGITGTTFNRPAFQQMLKEIESKKVNCVIVKDLSRFGRNYIEAGTYLEYTFPMYNIRFIAINDNIDSITERSKNDSIMLPFKNIINDAYSSDISIKVRSQFVVKRKNGDCVAAFAPFGYCKDTENKNRLMIDTRAAEVVRDIFKWKLCGYSQKYIVERLNNMGIPAPSDYKSSMNPNYRCSLQKNEKSSWTTASINSILSNEVYSGHLIQGRSTTPNVKIKKIIKLAPDQWIRVENTHEPLVSTQDFLLVQKLLKKDIRAAPGEDKIYPLSGYIYCGDCGDAMHRKVVTKKDKKYAYYVCGTYRRDRTACQSHQVNAQKLESIILSFLKCYTEASANVDMVWKELKQQNNFLPFENLKIQNEYLKKNIVRKHELEILCNQLEEDLLEEIITQKEYKELKELYSKQIERLNKSITIIKKGDKAAFVQKQQLLQFSVSKSPFVQLTRDLVVQMIERIEVYTKDYIKVICRFDSNIERKE